MRVAYDAVVAQPTMAVWRALSDVDRLVAAVPGSTLRREGDAVTGSLRVRLRSGQVTYRVTARADVAEAGDHTAVVAVTGKEARGEGTLAASLTFAVRSGGEGSEVAVSGDLEASGRAAVAAASEWDRLVRQLLDGVLAALLAPVAPLPPPPASPPSPPPSPPASPRPPNALSGRSAADREPVAVAGWLVAVSVALLLAILLRRRRKGPH